MLAELKKEYEKEGLYFVSLTIEPNDSASKVSGWLKRNGGESLTAARSSSQAKGKLIQMAGLEGVSIPAIVLISADGQVKSGLEAPFSHADLEAAVKQLAAK
ncbi:MAG: hypothetical protein KDB82_14505 [Planctomycetes bacterium]|nr:hypothetical protein [Planctomycetota bacterium]